MDGRLTLFALLIVLGGSSEATAGQAFVNTGSSQPKTQAQPGKCSGSTTNLALNRPATQSSTDFKGAPGRAVDGNRNAIYAKKSCSHTAMERDPWWRVDLGSSQCVDRVVVVKRQRIGGHWLEGFQVYVGDNPNVVENPTCGKKQSVAGKDVITVDCGGLTGRYVGIALPGKKQYLILCEVEVYGGTSPTEVSRPMLKYGQCAEGTTNLALNRPATQSSTDFKGAPGRAVDGNRNAIYAKKSCSHTAMERDPWWRVDLGSSQCIDRVVVVKRQRIGGHWLEGFQVYVGDNPNVVENPTCGGKQSVAGKDVITVDCGGLTGRYVGIALPGKKQYLILCEVEVYGGVTMKTQKAGLIGSVKAQDAGLTSSGLKLQAPKPKGVTIITQKAGLIGSVKAQDAGLTSSGLKLQAPKPKASVPPPAPQAPKPKVVQTTSQKKPGAAGHGVVITIGQGSSGGSSGSAGNGAINIINNQISVYSSGGGCHCKTAKCACPGNKGTDPSTSKPAGLTEILLGSVERNEDSPSNVQELDTVETVSEPFVSEVSEERVVLQPETRETQGDLEDQLADGMTVSDDDMAVSDDDMAVSDDDISVSDDYTAVSDDYTAVSDDDTTVSDDYTAVSDDDMTVSDDYTSVSDDYTAVSDDDTTVSDEDTAVSDDYTAVSDDGTAVSDDYTAVSDDDMADSDDDMAVSDDDMAVSDDYTAVSDDDMAVYDEYTAVSDDGTAVSDDYTTVSDDDTAVSDDYTAVSDDGTAVSDDYTAVSDDDMADSDDDMAVSDDDMAVSDDYTAVSDDDMAVSDDYTAVSDDGTALSDDYTAVSDDDTAVSDDYTAVYDDDTAVSDDYTAVSDDYTAVSDDYTAVSDDGTAVSDDGTAVSDDGTAVSDDRSAAQAREKLEAVGSKLNTLRELLNLA
ncbi:uncharacterized protein LOC144919130 isoform X2 [Branchiostoma floridae x Branchiostoma belcheri]